MEAVLIRRSTWLDTTPGRLYLDGRFEAFTLEDRIRELPGVPVETWKSLGKTAIPAGRYRLVLEDSGKFGPETLTVADVPGFTYIRIHAGNSDEDTEGCLIVGQVFAEEADDGGNILRSRDALTALRAKLVPAIKAGPVYLTILNP